MSKMNIIMLINIDQNRHYIHELQYARLSVCIQITLSNSKGIHAYKCGLLYRVSTIYFNYIANDLCYVLYVKVKCSVKYHI